MHRELNQVEFTIFDTETTGLDYRGGDRVVEIAALRIKDDSVISSFQTLVNPKREISEGAFRVNKISSEMLAKAPLIEEVMPGFLNFIKGSCLCSYNAPFDLGFLNNELVISGYQPLKEFAVVDILGMAKRLIPKMERYALWFVAKNFNLEAEQQHRALSDVELTFQVFQKLKQILNTKGINDYKSFLSLFGLKFNQLEDIENQKLVKIQEAIDLQARLKIRYFSCSDAVLTEREVIPKLVKQENKSRYLVGFCCLKNDERTFRIDSILDLQIV